MALLKFIVGICVIGLLGYIAYHQFATAPMSSKQIVEDGLAQVKATQKLAPEREQLLRLQLAITDYIANFGAPPDDLAVLVPDYFESIPLDPATKRPFAYLREGNSYKLGEEVTGKSLSSAVAAAKQEKTEQEADETALDEVFVNPNTMQIEDFMYDASGKRDPFLPFDFSGASLVDESIPPLERYELGQLEVTAIVSDQNGNYTAIVEDETGRGYPVRQGTKIGNANGVVVSIEKDRLNIVETSVDFTGQEQKRAVVKEIASYEDGDGYQKVTGAKRKKKRKR